MRRSFAVLAALLSLASIAACSKKEEAPAAPPPAPIAMSTVDPSMKAVDFEIQPDGKTTIDMPAPKERIKGDTTAMKGTLHVVLSDITKTRGDIMVDLDTFATHTFGNDDDKTQTKHAHTWLQLDEMVKDPAMKERNRWTHYAIRSIDGASATDVSKVPATPENGEDVRTITLTAHGDYELHSLPSKGVRDVQLEVKLHYPTGAAADSKPSSIEVHTKAPLVITLADHDVKPRDGEGILAQKAFGLLGTKVADVANVSIDFKAK